MLDELELCELGLVLNEVYFIYLRYLKDECLLALAHGTAAFISTCV